MDPVEAGARRSPQCRCSRFTTASRSLQVRAGNDGQGLLIPRAQDAGGDQVDDAHHREGDGHSGVPLPEAEHRCELPNYLAPSDHAKWHVVRTNVRLY